MSPASAETWHIGAEKRFLAQVPSLVLLGACSHGESRATPWLDRARTQPCILSSLHCARGVRLLSKRGGGATREAELVMANKGLRELLPEEVELA